MLLLNTRHSSYLSSIVILYDIGHIVNQRMPARKVVSALYVDLTCVLLLTTMVEVLPQESDNDTGNVYHGEDSSMPDCIIDNQSIYYYEHPAQDSTLPPILLIHGLSGQYINWPPQLRHLSNATIIAPDLPAHGRSEGPVCDSVSAHAEVLFRLMDALHIQRFIIAGHSMGGAIGQKMAAMRPERVEGLILLATSTRVYVADELLSASPDEYEDMVDYLIDFGYGPSVPSSVKRVGQRVMTEAGYEVTRADLIACAEFDSREEISQITCPTLVIGGTADRLTPARTIRKLCAHIPLSEMHLIHEAGHMVPVEFPDRVTALIQEWLEDTWDSNTVFRQPTFEQNGSYQNIRD